MYSKPYIVCCATAVFLGLIFAYLLRFSITGVDSQSAYKLDRWTGEVLFMSAEDQYFLNKPFK